MKSRAFAAAVTVGTVLLVSIPSVMSGYTQSLITTALVFGILAVSLDLVWGYAGILDLGHGLWFGLGAFAVGAMTTKIDSVGNIVEYSSGAGLYLLAAVLALVAAAALAGLIAWLGMPLGRSSAFYLAIVTLTVGELLATLYTQTRGLTGGDNGLFGFQLPSVSYLQWYWFTLVVLVIVLGLVVVFVRSDFGIVLRAVRDNEERAVALGFNARRVKSIVYVIGAMVAAFAGVIYGAQTGIVSADLFSFLTSLQILIWVALGGRGTIFGPLVGALVLNIVGPQMNGLLPYTWQLVVGLTFVMVVAFLPEGLTPPIFRRIARVLSPRLLAGGPRREVVAEESGLTSDPVSTLPALRIKNLSRSYGSLHVLKDINLEIVRGQVLGVVGPNGAGKSTLLAALSDGRVPYRGQVLLNIDERTKDRHKGGPMDRLARRGVVRKFQAPGLFASLTVAETLLLAQLHGHLPSIWRRSRRVEIPDEAYLLAGLAGLDADWDAPVASLPHGTSQALDLAAVIATSPKVVLLDEPTAGLTKHERTQVGNLIMRLAHERQLAVVLIEHDLDFVVSTSDRLCVLHQGTVLIEGNPAEVVSSPIVQEAYLGPLAQVGTD